MSRGIGVENLLRPLKEVPEQYYLGTGLHTLGLIGWILSQTGRAEIWVSTFSTSDAFLSGFLNLRKKELISRATLVADMKASRKTLQLSRLMRSCFESVRLSQNHSKVVLVRNEGWMVTVISSQNQTYGDRAECTMVTTSKGAFDQVFKGLDEIIKHKSIAINGIYRGRVEEDQDTGRGSDDPGGDWYPIGI